MKIETFDKDGFTLQPGWRLSEWENIEEIFGFWEQRRKADAELQTLFVLDDRHQAGYTTGHALFTSGLDTPPEGVLTGKELEVYETDMELSPSRCAQVISTNLLKEASQVDLKDFKERLNPIDYDFIDLLADYQQPDDVFQSPLTAVSFPADEPSLAIAARPNGYFSGDLSPAENYCLAELIREKFGLEIVGLGSWSAAYLRSDPLNTNEATALVGQVRGMYEDMTDKRAEEWARVATGKRWFLLHYRGS